MCSEGCSHAMQLHCVTCWKAAANCTVVEKEECSDSGQKPSSPRKCYVLLNVYTEQTDLFYFVVFKDTSDASCHGRSQNCVSLLPKDKGLNQLLLRVLKSQGVCSFSNLKLRGFQVAAVSTHTHAHTHTSPLKKKTKQLLPYKLLLRGLHCAMLFHSPFLFLSSKDD